MLTGGLVFIPKGTTKPKLPVRKGGEIVADQIFAMNRKYEEWTSISKRTFLADLKRWWRSADNLSDWFGENKFEKLADKLKDLIDKVEDSGNAWYTPDDSEIRTGLGLMVRVMNEAALDEFADDYATRKTGTGGFFEELPKAAGSILGGAVDIAKGAVESTVGAAVDAIAKGTGISKTVLTVGAALGALYLIARR